MHNQIALFLAAGFVAHAAAAQDVVQCTVMADAATGAILIRQGQCEQRVTPASTFKIAISLMGYDSRLLRDEHMPALPFRPGYIDWRPEWRATTDPTSWMRDSVVWYSQQITTALGEERFRRYVRGFQYGNQDVAGSPGKPGLTYAWLGSSLKISADEQVGFLLKLVNRQLPVSPLAYDMTSRITRLAYANGWEIHGKTGTGFPVLPDGSADEAHAYGWFVGWAKRGERVVVFARLVQDQKREPGPAGLRVKDGLLRDLPGILGSLRNG